MTVSLLMVLAACGGDKAPAEPGPTSDTESGTSTLDTGTTDTAPLLQVPDPGPDDSACLDAEPNDTPDQAVPCGPVHEDATLGTGAVYPLEFGNVDAEDPVDWYVFSTGPDTEELHQFAWWPGVTANLVDLAMYSVEDGELVEAWRSEDAAQDGENMDFDLITVQPDTVYLLEVMWVEGVGDYGL